MSNASVVVRASHTYRASVERVFDAWLDPVVAERFLFATPEGRRTRVEIDPRVGGRFRIDEERGKELAMHLGEYLEIDRPRRLVFTFATDPEEAPSRVTIEVTPKNSGSEAVLTHVIAPEWAVWADRTRAGWERILRGLEHAI